MTEKMGSGEEIGRIDLGELGALVFVDDGCNDPDTYVRFEDDEGEYISWGRNRINERNTEGDEWVMEQIAKAGSSGTGGAPGVTSSSFDREPPTYVCHDCKRTFPRGTNQTPNIDEDTCPDCGGGR